MDIIERIVNLANILDANKLLRSVLAEVNNTFGERHGYLCFNKDIEPISKFNTTAPADSPPYWAQSRAA